MEHKPRYTIIDLNEFEKKFDLELTRHGNDTYTNGYVRAIKNVHEFVLDPNKTIEFPSSEEIKNWAMEKEGPCCAADLYLGALWLKAKILKS